MRNIILIFSALIFFIKANSQASQKMDFETYNPVNTLVVPEHKLTKSKFTFIDVHNHQWNMGSQDLSELIRDMDKMNMKVMVNLSGIGGDELKKIMMNVKNHYPNRFIVFTNIDFTGVGEDGWTDKAVKRLEADVKNGAN